MRRLTQKLIDIYHEHGTIIIGVDFDNTIYPLDSDYIGICNHTVEILKAVQQFSTLCLYTIADDSSLKYKLSIAEYMGLKFSYVNSSPLRMRGDDKKPFFNVLLDDKAGLEEVHAVLAEFIDYIVEEREKDAIT